MNQPGKDGSAPTFVSTDKLPSPKPWKPSHAAEIIFGNPSNKQTISGLAAGDLATDPERKYEERTTKDEPPEEIDGLPWLEDHSNEQTRSILPGDSAQNLNCRQAMGFSLENHEELLDINPEAKTGKTGCVIKVHFRTKALEMDTETGKVTESLSPGHIYYEKFDLTNQKRRFCGHNIKSYGEGGMNAHEMKNHDAVAEYQRDTGEQILHTKIFYVTKEQADKFDEFSKKIETAPYRFGFYDCSDIGVELFEYLNMPTTYNYLFKKAELDQKWVGLKMKYKYGSRTDPIQVTGRSCEEVAQKYKVSVDRVHKKYHIEERDKNISHTLSEDSLYINMLKDREYLILPDIE